jgi:hypothetical protein
MSLLGDINYDDIDGVQPGEGPQPVPPGTYHAVIVQAESKPNSKGTGQYLELQWSILNDGPVKGRRVFSRLNLQNRNVTAVNIARAELKCIADAIGARPQTEAEFLNKPCKIVVACEKRQDDPTKMSNRIKEYHPSSAPPNPQLEQAVAQNGQAAADDEATPF